jgi:hypothetical protein
MNHQRASASGRSSRWGGTATRVPLGEGPPRRCSPYGGRTAGSCCRRRSAGRCPSTGFLEDCVVVHADDHRSLLDQVVLVLLPLFDPDVRPVQLLEGPLHPLGQEIPVRWRLVRDLVAAAVGFAHAVSTMVVPRGPLRGPFLHPLCMQSQGRLDLSRESSDAQDQMRIATSGRVRSASSARSPRLPGCSSMAAPTVCYRPRLLSLLALAGTPRPARR